MKKSNHSKKIVKQLKKEYKEDLERSGNVKQEIKSGGMLLMQQCAPLQIPTIFRVECKFVVVPQDGGGFLHTGIKINVTLERKFIIAFSNKEKYQTFCLLD